MKQINIQDFIEQLRAQIANDCSAFLNNNKIEVILGIDSIKKCNLLGKLTKNLSLSNELLAAYLILFSGKKKSYDTFIKEILPLSKIPFKKIGLEMRKLYAEYHGIKIHTRIKSENFVQSISFTPEEEEALQKIEESFSAWVDTIQDTYPQNLVWNESQNEFSISQQMAEAIEDKCIMKASTADVDLAVGALLVSCGLKQVKAVADSGKLDHDHLQAGNGFFTRGSSIEKTLLDVAIGKIKEPEHKSGPLSFDLDWPSLLAGRLDLKHQEVDLFNIEVLPGIYKINKSGSVS